MLHKLVPKALLPASRASKRIATEFSDAAGLVYFGYVSQRDDEHHILRGVTVSTKHRDDHYCIGTYDGYDVVYVERSDTIQSGKHHLWHIIEIDLKTKLDIPHMFVNSKVHGSGFHELVKTKYHTTLPHTLGTTQPYSNDLNADYDIHITPTHAVMAEQLITPEIAKQIAKHFKGLSIEVTNDSLYIYSGKVHVTASLLMTMLTNGVWLAEQIDTNSRQLIQSTA